MVPPLPELWINYTTDRICCQWGKNTPSDLKYQQKHIQAKAIFLLISKAVRRAYITSQKNILISYENQQHSLHFVYKHFINSCLALASTTFYTIA